MPFVPPPPTEQPRIPVPDQQQPELRQVVQQQQQTISSATDPEDDVPLPDHTPTH